MPPVTCPKCDTVADVSGGVRPIAVRCAECGFKIRLEKGRDGFETSGEDGRKPKKRTPRRAKVGDYVDPNDGVVFHLSFFKSLLPTVICVVGVMGAPFGMYLFVRVFLTALDFRGPVNNRIAILAIAPLASLLVAVIGVLCGIVGFKVYIYPFVRRFRLVLGESYLQEIAGNGDLQMQIPFDDIVAVEIGTKTESNGARYQFIGIDVANPKRKDTLIPRLRFWRKNFGCDAAIFNHYEISLGDLCTELRRHLIKGTARSEDSDLDSRNDWAP